MCADYRVVFSKSAMRQVAKQYGAHISEIEQAIVRTLIRQLENGMGKVKVASHIRYGGLTVYECRVNTFQINLRVGFTHSSDLVQVVYASKTLTKADFTAELERFLKTH